MPENTTPMPRAAAVTSPARGASSRSPFVFDLRELGRRPGTLRDYRRRVPASAGLGVDLIGVPDGAPLDLDLRLEAVTEGVLVTGTVSGPLTGQCGRCLDPIADELHVDICELFAYEHSTTDETSEQDEVYRVDGELLDVEPAVRDAIVLGLPWTPLCRPDCPGLCPDCGRRLADLPDGHRHDQLDPRWAALAAFGATDPAPGSPPEQPSAPSAATPSTAAPSTAAPHRPAE